MEVAGVGTPQAVTPRIAGCTGWPSHPAGEADIARMRTAVVAFDRRLRRGLSAPETARLGELLDRLVTNVTTGSDIATSPIPVRARERTAR